MGLIRHFKFIEKRAFLSSGLDLKIFKSPRILEYFFADSEDTLFKFFVFIIRDIFVFTFRFARARARV